jgi:hypothetical protein
MEDYREVQIRVWNKVHQAKTAIFIDVCRLQGYEE